MSYCCVFLKGLLRGLEMHILRGIEIKRAEGRFQLENDGWSTFCQSPESLKKKE